MKVFILTSANPGELTDLSEDDLVSDVLAGGQPFTTFEAARQAAEVILARCIEQRFEGLDDPRPEPKPLTWLPEPGGLAEWRAKGQGADIYDRHFSIREFEI